ncbi:MAG: T9SS type A sorting domain-containing protein [Candidatus Hatepunaea meridiana]|nr:T9SS type A sorting domain-containing protein [Candidatus Hatepunaea meridiana]
MGRTKFRIIIGILTLAFSLLFPLVYGEIINVPDDFETIQDAIDESENRDTVLVRPGTYVENIDFNGKNITVGSLFLTTGNDAYIDSTVIDGSDNFNSVVTFADGESNETLLIGFTIRYGSGNARQNYEIIHGGGIYCHQSDPVISYCKVVDNTISDALFSGNGGGIYCFQSSAVIENCTIAGNSACDGGGIAILFSNVTVRSCIILNNEAQDEYGGGIFTAFSDSVIITDCNIIGNSSGWFGGGVAAFNTQTSIVECEIRDNQAESYGGGMFLADSGEITSCIITGNSSLNGGGIAFGRARFLLSSNTIAGNTADSLGGGLYISAGSSVVLINSILWNDRPQEVFFAPEYDPCEIIIAYTDVAGGIDEIETNDNGEVMWLDSNINADPMFIHPENSDYRLSFRSPCIDSGTELFVWEDDTLVTILGDDFLGEAPDMGRIEFGLDAIETEKINQPESFIMLECYPNPFNSTTTITYSLPTISDVTLKVYNLLGREESILNASHLPPGTHNAIFSGENLPSGLYFVQLEASGLVLSRKLILIK